MTSEEFCIVLNPRILCGYDSKKKVFNNEGLDAFHPADECL